MDASKALVGERLTVVGTEHHWIDDSVSKEVRP